MEILKSISADDADNILSKGDMTLSDRFKLDSFTHTTLANEYNDLNHSELQELYRIEFQNLKKLLNCVAIMCGVYEDGLKMLLSMDFTKEVISYAKNELKDEEEKNKCIFSCLLKYMMADFKFYKNGLVGNPVFVGKIPSKLFSFRQATAESWWTKYVEIFKFASSNIYAKRGAEDAFAYALSNTAYYLNKSQTFRFFPKSTDSNMNDTIYRIVDEYLREMFGDNSMLKTKNGVTFYKDL